MVLKTLEHDEPVPVFAHEKIKIGYVHTLYACEDSDEEFILRCFGLKVAHTGQHFGECFGFTAARGVK